MQTCNRRKAVDGFSDAVVAFCRDHRKSHLRTPRRRNNNNRFGDVVCGKAALKVALAVEPLALCNRHRLSRLGPAVAEVVALA